MTQPILLTGGTGFIGSHTAVALAEAGLPVVPPQEMTPAHFMEHMAVDKKVLDGRLRLVLLRQLGEAVVTDDYPNEILQATLSADYRAIVAQL